MTPISYQVHLDTLRNGQFAGAIDDLSSYVSSLIWRQGMMSPYQEIADSSFAQIVLNNDTKVFTPEVTGSERVVNGNFSSWSGGNPTSWTVTGESGTNPEISQVAPTVGHGDGGSGACNLYSTASALSISENILTSGTTYKVSFNLTYAGSGAIQFFNNTTPIFGPIRKVGYYEFIFNATSNNFKISIFSFTCNITIDNVSVKQTAKYHLMEPGMLVRIRGTKGTTNQYYLGKIADPIQYGIDPQSGQLEGRMVILRLEDPTTDVARADYSPQLLTNVDTYTAIQQVMTDAVVHWPQSNKNCILDAQGNSEIGSVKIFSSDLITGETGKTIHDYVGDFADRGDGVSAFGHIKDLVEAECGARFWWDARQGKFNFHNRHHDLLNSTIAATLTGLSLRGVEYSYGKYRKNRVSLSYQLRKVGDPESVVWTMTGLPIQIKNNASKTFTARYKDPNNEKARVGVKDHINPTPDVDFVATESESSGNSVSEKLSISVDWGATSAKITFYNQSGSDNVWLQSAHLRATPLIATPETFKYQDADNIGWKNGTREAPMEVPFISNRNLAEDYARYIVNKFKTPRSQFDGITFNAYETVDAQNAAHGYSIGTKITINDSYTNHSGTYIIVGEDHRYSHAEQEHVVHYVLKLDAREKWCVIGQTGRDELDSGILIAF